MSQSVVSANVAGEGGAGRGGPGDTGEGGGIRASSLSLTNSTISGNTNGGVSAYTGQITFSAIANNTGYGVGGGAWFRNSIIAGNGTNCTRWFVSDGYNLIGNTAGCTILGDPTGNLLNVDPLLGPLQDNGGSTFTHALLPGSPALNAGVCTEASGATVTTDQRGYPRPAGPACDIGAYESQLQSLHQLYLPVITRS